MFQDEDLQNHLESSFTISSQAAVIAEWNMNIPGNIFKLGNYRYRPSGAQYNVLPNFFDRVDLGNFYTGATNADVTVQSGFEENGTTPLLFTYPKEKEKIYYSLEDCLKPFRPRSGINKASYFNNKYVSNPNKDMYRRPRYYMPHREDEFKYWRSYRTESSGTTLASSNIEYGVSKNSSTGIYQIDDCVPFAVYKEEVPANRIVVKVQTNVGDLNLGPFKTAGSNSINDPFFGNQNKTVPQRFTVQYLDSNNQWLDAYEFDQTSLRDDGSSPIFGTDGYLSLEYGIQVPVLYKNNFFFVGTTITADSLPTQNITGYAYLVVTEINTRGLLYIYNGEDYDISTPVYDWKVGTDGVYETTQFVTDLTDPSYFQEQNDGNKIYREFVFVKGLRLVVESMNTPNTPLELIEISPRLVTDLTKSMIDYEVSKSLSDISTTALPVGQLMSSVGSIKLFDEDFAFNINNVWTGTSGSIVAKYVQKNIKFTFYEVIKNVSVTDESGNLENINYYVPVKNLYSEGIPQTDQSTGTITITLRDFYFYLESVAAPSILITEASLSQAICILLDSIGFSNYVFRRLSTQSDPVIPYFFIAPNQNVAEVLNQLAIATQSAMFFDEYNNFVVMTKEYLLDSTGERSLDMTLVGSNNPVRSGVNENVYSGQLPNIISISSEDQKVYNAGSINYTARYIQRSYGNLQQALYTDRSYIYKPSLLWEVSGTESTRTANSQQQQKYVLGAMPLNTTLTASIPSVVNRQIVNNVFDLGENAYWITRYKGFFYANAEIIKYDAVEYSITGTGRVWISDNLEYQKYFSELPFNGKIYPTGLVRIYAQPYYETIDGILKLKNGPVVEHGRGQFGTPVVIHNAGLDSYWTNNNNVQGCNMKSQYLFSTSAGDSSEVGIAYSVGTTFYSPDVSLVQVGQPITIVSGTGTLSTSSQTVVTAVNNVKIPEAQYYTFTVNVAPSVALATAVISLPKLPKVEIGSAGINKPLAQKSQRTGIIKNFLSSGYSTETNTNFTSTANSSTIQSSALVLNGPDFGVSEIPRDFISYVHKPITGAYKHFGTRIRLIGKVETLGDRAQSPVGGMTYFNLPGTDPTQTISIGGGSGGISLVDPNTNNGYYFELSALTASNIESYLKKDSSGNSSVVIDNIMFYKIQKQVGTSDAIPVKLWGATGNIIVNDGNLAGQYRFFDEQNPTVYDIALEYVDINSTTRVFYLYINQKLVKTITDFSPIPLYASSVALFVRGTSKAMFENVYMLSQNYSQNSVFSTGTPIASVFGDEDNEINASEALSKYALSGIVQKTYLTGVDPTVSPRYSLDFEEFGTIMRECAYFNIKYDRAYPALYAKIAPTLNRLKGYTVSGFSADSYGAEFLVFNNTDRALNLDETTGNFLRIIGVTFTQDTTNTISVDDYLNKRGNLSDPEFKGDVVINSPYRIIEQYDRIKESRILYGKNEFSLDSAYIQDQDTAENLIGWIVDKSINPRKSVGLNVFPTPTIQLGDMVTIDYKSDDGLDIVASDSTRFVVYNISYARSIDGPSMTLYLSEV
jgi:hypothetical protein